MARKAQSKLAALNAAFKTITTGDFSAGDALLQPTSYNRFLRIIQDGSKLLAETTRKNMPTPKVKLHRTGFLTRVLRAGDAADGTHKVLVQSEYAKPAFQTNALDAFEVQGTVSIYDKALRRNMEKEYYRNTLLDEFNKAIGVDLEELFVFMNTAIAPATDLLMSKGDGWVKLATNKVYGVDAAGAPSPRPKNFDPVSTDAAAGFPINMFQSMLLALPKQYLRNESEFRYYVDFSTMDAYRTQLAKRVGAAADSSLIDGKVRDYKGIPVERVPMLERYTTPAAGGTGRSAMLQHPKNMAWGVFHEVTVEPSRWPEERRTAFVVTAEVDAGYEDENACVVALIDQARPV